jgi:hypothetical protein
VTERVGLHTRLVPGADERYDGLHRGESNDPLSVVFEVGR